MSFVLGLTGSIGMGKSTTAAMFRSLGVPVHDADATVHAFYRGEATPLIEAAFPGTTRQGIVDRAMLGERVIGQPGQMQRLEAIIHPLVRQSENMFLAKAGSLGAQLVVLDVPLLFETGGQVRCDAVLVVTAAAHVQRGRVLSRPGMGEARFQALLSSQMPDSEKRRKAHFLVDTGHGLESARHEVQAILRALAGQTGCRASQNRSSKDMAPHAA